MRNLFIIFSILILATSSAIAAPNWNPDGKPIMYDVSYNIALRHKLEDAFDKKYIIKKTSDTTVYSYPTDAYYREVIVPYDLQKIDSCAEELKKRNKN